MAWYKIKFQINFGKLFKDYKMYSLSAAIFLFAMTFLIANSEYILKLSYKNYSEKYITLLESHIASDINKLKQDAREISKIPDVRQYIKDNDIEKLADI